MVRSTRSICGTSPAPAQIQQDLAAPITGPVDGLIAVWGFNGNARDTVAVYNGTAHGSATFGDPAAPAGAWLTTSELPDFRFKVRITSTSVITACRISCVGGTLTNVSGAVRHCGVFVRVIGRGPTRYLWPRIARFDLAGRGLDLSSSAPPRCSTLGGP
jgi:hypothetical protein